MVFKSLYLFCKRHKWKLVTVSIICTGGYAGYKYLKGWWEQYRSEQTTVQLESLRVLQSFETNVNTCNNMIISLLQELKTTIYDQLDSHKITNTLKSRPVNKIELWNELKVISFTQYLVIGYACCMLVVFLRVQMSILGGIMCQNSQKEDINPIITEDTEKKFLGIVQYNVTEGIKKFIKVAKEVVVTETAGYSLKYSLNYSELSNLLNTLQKQLVGSLFTMEVSNEELDGEVDMTKLITYMIDSYDEKIIGTESQYQVLMNVTMDVLESKECQSILRHTINGFFSQLDSIVANGFLSASQSLPSASLPVAKVIPLLSDMAYSVLGDNVVESHIMQGLLSHNELHLFAYNIFEAVTISVN